MEFRENHGPTGEENVSEFAKMSWVILSTRDLSFTQGKLGDFFQKVIKDASRKFDAQIFIMAGYRDSNGTLTQTK